MEKFWLIAIIITIAIALRLLVNYGRRRFQNKNKEDRPVGTLDEVASQLIAQLKEIPSGGYVLEVAGESQTNRDGSRRQDIIAQLQKGDPVTLVREPNNQFDRNAIRIDSHYGTIGYIPREIASYLATYIDMGGQGGANIGLIAGGDVGRPSRGVWLNLFLDRDQ